MKIEQKNTKQSIISEELQKDLNLNPLVETTTQKFIINPTLYSDFVYEFRKTRQELEKSAERIIRLAKIGMLINKVRFGKLPTNNQKK
ncbi:MAG: hypothetical protein N3D10_03920 [Candidatus Micrarchaeota archaeon]|nr:hypothetical protein [Candidatus Micrarchaeota archaeon]